MSVSATDPRTGVRFEVDNSNFSFVDVRCVECGSMLFRVETPTANTIDDLVSMTTAATMAHATSSPGCARSERKPS